MILTSDPYNCWPSLLRKSVDGFFASWPNSHFVILYKSKQSNQKLAHLRTQKNLLGNLAIWVPMNSPGPPLPRFDILS